SRGPPSGVVVSFGVPRAGGGTVQDGFIDQRASGHRGAARRWRPEVIERQHQSSVRVYLMLNDISAQAELLETVRTISSPALKVFVLAWACDCSMLDTLFAVPPRAVLLTLNVAVQVPLALIVVVSVIVPACAILSAMV